MAVQLSRREFLGTRSGAACSASLNMAEIPGPHPGAGYTGTLCVFSKPLPGMDWRRLARAAKGVGFGGIDLTVGHLRDATGSCSAGFMTLIGPGLLSVLAAALLPKGQMTR